MENRTEVSWSVETAFLFSDDIAGISHSFLLLSVSNTWYTQCKMNIFWVWEIKVGKLIPSFSFLVLKHCGEVVEKWKSSHNCTVFVEFHCFLDWFLLLELYASFLLLLMTFSKELWGPISSHLENPPDIYGPNFWNFLFHVVYLVYYCTIFDLSCQFPSNKNK